jgi:chromosome partitioning protein
VREALKSVSRETPAPTSDSSIARTAGAVREDAPGRPGEGDWPRPKKCRIITVANQKGGVGKTTSTVNLAAALALHGARVLVVDLDPQGNASTALGVEHHTDIPSVYRVLLEGVPFSDIVVPAVGLPNCFCAPATLHLAGAEVDLVPLVARETRLRRALEAFDTDKFDYVLIDCPPSLGLLTVNALTGAEELLIPIQTEYYALEGLSQLMHTVDLVKQHLNPNLWVSTILLTMYDARTRLAAQVADEVRSHFNELVLNTVIPRSVRVSEAPSYGESVLTYDPGSSGALAYTEAAREIAFRGAMTAERETP